MASRTTTFWVFMGILVLLHLVLRLALGFTLVPDLIVVAALLGARRLGAVGAAVYGLLLGILADSLAMVAFGATSVAFVIVCFLGSRSRNFFEGESYPFLAFYAFFGAWLVEAIRFVAGGAMARGQEPMLLLTEGALLALYTAITAVVAMLAYRAFSGKR
jgi:cell shape-determining protein MreD